MKKMNTLYIVIAVVVIAAAVWYYFVWGVGNSTNNYKVNSNNIIQTQTEKIEVGKILPGLKLSSEFAEGQHYWDQTVDSIFGSLYYKQPQYRDGLIRWRTQDNKTTITVDTDGIVTKIEHDALNS